MSPARALRLAAARGAQKVAGLQLVVEDLREARPDQENALDAFEQCSLLILLDGPEGERAALGLDHALISALVEQQTLGKVLKKQGAERKPTRTDAAMAEPWINEMLLQFESLLREERTAYWTTGYRFGAMMEGLRVLELALNREEYRSFEMSVGVGEAGRAARMVMLLPLRTDPAEEAEKEAEPSAPAREAVRRHMLEAQVSLNAMLYRTELSLQAFRDVRVGESICIPRAALGACWLEAQDGQKIVGARAGQLEGFRAVRIVSQSAEVPTEAGLAQAVSEMEGLHTVRPEIIDRIDSLGPLADPDDPQSLAALSESADDPFAAAPELASQSEAPRPQEEAATGVGDPRLPERDA